MKEKCAPELMNEEAEAGKTDSKTTLSGRHAIRLDEICQALVAYFETERPYLNPNLSHGNIARHLGINTCYLTQAFKYVPGGGFYGFVNNYRVDYAVGLIRQRKGMILSKQLWVESGFGSDSAFHTNFTERTGVTPQKYVWDQGDYKHPQNRTTICRLQAVVTPKIGR